MVLFVTLKNNNVIIGHCAYLNNTNRLYKEITIIQFNTFVESVKPE